MLAPLPTRHDRVAMHNANTLKIGLFGANCSSGRAVTMIAERWSGSWPDNLKLAKMADEAGIDFLLPIGRWKGYGGDTDYQGATLETLTWASGLLASTRRITVFGTVHAPLFNPVIAAKEMVTADHIGEGRFGLPRMRLISRYFPWKSKSSLSDQIILMASSHSCAYS